MKQITTEQINSLLQAFYAVNAPVQTFEGVKKLLSELPNVVEKEETPKKK